MPGFEERFNGNLKLGFDGLPHFDHVRNQVADLYSEQVLLHAFGQTPKQKLSFTHHKRDGVVLLPTHSSRDAHMQDPKEESEGLVSQV